MPFIKLEKKLPSVPSYQRLPIMDASNLIKSLTYYNLYHSIILLSKSF